MFSKKKPRRRRIKKKTVLLKEHIGSSPQFGKLDIIEFTSARVTWSGCQVVKPRFDSPVAWDTRSSTCAHRHPARACTYVWADAPFGIQYKPLEEIGLVALTALTIHQNMPYTNCRITLSAQSPSFACLPLAITIEIFLAGICWPHPAAILVSNIQSYNLRAWRMLSIKTFIVNWIWVEVYTSKKYGCLVNPSLTERQVPLIPPTIWEFHAIQQG